MIGTDAFQETPIVEVCRGITKHHYLVTDVNDLARVMREAFHIATTGRPGPVLIDMPKDVQHAQTVPDYDAPMNLPGYHIDESARRRPEQIAAGRRGDQARQAAGDLRRRRHHHRRGQRRAARARPQDGHPRHDDRDGPRRFPGDDPLSLDMLGMHGSVYANYAVDQADLLIALGVRFDDRVTGKVDEFAKHGKIVHIDIDPSEINKNKEAHIPIVQRREVRPGRAEQDRRAARRTSAEWHRRSTTWKQHDPFNYDRDFAGILPQHAIASCSAS